MRVTGPSRSVGAPSPSTCCRSRSKRVSRSAGSRSRVTGASLGCGVGGFRYASPAAALLNPREGARAARSSTRGVPGRSIEPPHREDSHDGRALVGGGGEIDLGGDRPVVVPGRVVEDLPHLPEPDPTSGFLV